MDDGANAILLGPNGVGKSMILKNIAHHALVRGHTVRFTTASDMLADLAAQDSATSLGRRLRRWTVPARRHASCARAGNGYSARGGVRAAADLGRSGQAIAQTGIVSARRGRELRCPEEFVCSGFGLGGAGPLPLVGQELAQA